MSEVMSELMSWLMSWLMGYGRGDAWVSSQGDAWGSMGRARVAYRIIQGEASMARVHLGESTHALVAQQPATRVNHPSVRLQYGARLLH